MGSAASRGIYKKKKQQSDQAVCDEQEFEEPLSCRKDCQSISASRTTSISRSSSILSDMKGCMQRMLSKPSSSLEVSIHSLRNNTIKSVSSSASFDLNLKACQDEKYFLGADDMAQDYLLSVHYVVKHLFGSDFSPPIYDLLSNSISVAKDPVSSPHTPITPPFENCCRPMSDQGTVPRVLDIVCGPGTWIMEMASTFPDAQFYGIDFVTSYPKNIKPRNAHFLTTDFLGPSGLPFPDMHFDFIHMRLVWSYFSKSDMQFVMSEVFRVLKPGGYFEIRDCDPVLKNLGPTGTQVFENFVSYVHEQHNIDVTWTQKLPTLLEHLGKLTDIHQQVSTLAFEEPGSMKACINSCLIDSIRSCKRLFMEACNLSLDECEMAIQGIIDEGLVNRSYLNFYVCWGRKSLVTEQLVTTSSPSRQESAHSSSCADNYWACKDDTNVLPLTPCQSPDELLDSEAISESADYIYQFARGFVE
ncbi:hypothetical protein BCV72DRAFT_237226 [Rhizopus microsporus var. microsporus]|uniref:Methyltransferase domain-containing protein n=2 Tax=Rhizopus microsporus TaxID=58291 RepID=A0A2G4SVT7_RHIZD|nr:uncharacterized protein RHIMIDRAFT_280741 [Rhizopus microsporus ATCC 52813]ORE00947.1 hypothetical protein BCV72DRAFT_237226 [Rhizopus microsporus var. microsporus]PHZ12903.1 hypothetical protein RHIMIDRAFT_280741 [Rhizopus microsporus ATCC 52813]